MVRLRWLVVAVALAEFLCCQPNADAQEKRRAIEIKVLEDDWGGAPPSNIRAVCASVAGELAAFVPDRVFDPITISRSKDSPIVIFGKGPKGERRVKLNVSGTSWAQFSYQFGHEFGHILCNYRPAKNPNMWFEESMCETAAIFAIRRMAKSWRERPPYSNWKSYAGALDDYANQYMRVVPKIEDGKFAAWFQKNEDTLRKFDRPSFNVVAVRALLPLLEKNPQHWKALDWLNQWDANRELTFAEYLADWHGRVPAAHKPFVADIARVFDIRLPAPKQGGDAGRAIPAAPGTDTPESMANRGSLRRTGPAWSRQARAAFPCSHGADSSAQ